MNNSDISIRDIEARLEAELAQHTELARQHREKMQEHSEKSTLHAAEARRVEEDLKNFRAVVSRWLPASEPVAAPPELFPAPGAPEVNESGDQEEKTEEGMPVAAAIAQTIDMAYGDDHEIEMNTLAEVVNGLYGKELAAPVDAKRASNALRRLLAEGKIYLVREGRPRHPAVYSKTPPRKEESNNAEVDVREA